MTDEIHPHPHPHRPGRRLFATVAGLVPFVPIVVALTLGGGGSVGTGARASVPRTRFAAVSPPKRPSHPNRLLPPGSGALVALVEHRTQMRSSPGGRAFASVPAQTPFGSPDAMWVRRLAGGWLGVVSPIAGNNRIGWIPASDASLSRVSWKLKVSLSARRLTVLDGDTVVARFTVAIGRPDAPTPTGSFAVTDRLSTGDPTGPYGCCILALSALAPHAIQDWSGGDRIAIHSSPDTSTIGEAISHGCVHVTDAEGRWLMDHIPIGTPTLITA